MTIETTRHTTGWAALLLLGALALAGCPSADDDDDSAVGDDDDTDVEGSAPGIENLDVYVDVPSGEADEHVIFAFDYTDADGDIRDGEIWLFVTQTPPLQDSDFAARAILDDEEDATSGSLMMWGNIGGTDGFPEGETFTFGVRLLDRAFHESNQLEAEFTIPGP